ncbi:MAG: bifunctional ornithine acetyltransferase/N-acetylglutamate synthase [Rhodospirillales bacterium]|nr:bifunctional ornithine acetyltransferase/N-acetylglutamate synthase [Rhodospirillales bacterium]
MAGPVSPLAVALPELPPLAGVRLSAAAAGIRYKGRTDVVMMEVAPGSTVAGVFTTNKCPGAPVDWCRAALKGGKARMVVVNAGNANVFTGKAGRDACAATAAAAAKLADCPAKQVFVASTGVIGEVLPHEKLVAALPGLQEGLREDGWEDAARGIMTTDTFPKAATRVAEIGGAEVRITGIAKGSGMIAPDMATMLCFVFTDAKIPADVLQSLLSKNVETTFNATTVDSDTSTSDTVLLIATGQAKLDDEERAYVVKKAKYIRRKRHNKKLAERIEAREREGEENERRKARADNLESPTDRLWDHPFYKLLAVRYGRDVPVGRMPIAYERWTYCVSDNLVDRLLIGQLVYWLRPKKHSGLVYNPEPRARIVNPEGDYEVAKTDEEMGAEIGVSARTIEGRRKVLVRRGLIKVRYKKFANKRTCHYSIDWDALADAYWDGGGDTNALKLPKPSNVVRECDDEDDEDA